MLILIFHSHTELIHTRSQVDFFFLISAGYKGYSSQSCELRGVGSMMVDGHEVWDTDYASYL